MRAAVLQLLGPHSPAQVEQLPNAPLLLRAEVSPDRVATLGESIATELVCDPSDDASVRSALGEQLRAWVAEGVLARPAWRVLDVGYQERALAEQLRALRTSGTPRTYPEGRNDGVRWYPSDAEQCGCCSAIRSPSRAFPWSLWRHCQTRAHCAQLIRDALRFGAEAVPPDARRVVCGDGVERVSREAIEALTGETAAAIVRSARGAR